MRTLGKVCMLFLNKSISRVETIKEETKAAVKYNLIKWFDNAKMVFWNIKNNIKNTQK